MSADWELYYHPLAGRGEFIRLVFEEAGVPYKDFSDAKIIQEKVKTGKLGGYPSFAPPVIKKGDFVLGQTPVCCKYLGKQFGLWPEKEEDVFYADQLNTTIHDFLAEGCLVFHGKNFIESHYTQKEETQPYIDWFKKDRFHKWMSTLERALEFNSGGHGSYILYQDWLIRTKQEWEAMNDQIKHHPRLLSGELCYQLLLTYPFAVGDKLTYVDLALLQVLRAAEASFSDTYTKQIDDFPLLKAHRARVESSPKLQAYFQSDRSRPMCDVSMM